MKIKQKMFILATGIMVIASVVLFWQQQTSAAALTDFEYIQSSLRQGAPANHQAIIITPSGVAAGQTIEIRLASQFNLSAIDYTDVDLADDGADLLVGPVASGSTWGVSVSGSTITIQSGTGAIAGGSTITVEIGKNATYQTAGDSQIVNPAVLADYWVSIAGTFGDTGSLLQTIETVYDAQVRVTARVGGDAPTPCSPPFISNVQAQNITNDSADITWTTDVSSYSMVEYGQTIDLELGSVLINDQVVYHSVPLTGLAADTVYYYRVISGYAGCGSTVSEIFSFTTAEIAGVYLRIKALPEKRLPSRGNWATWAHIKVFEAGTANLLVDQIVRTDNWGEDTSVDLNDFSFPLTVDVFVKEYSHLWHGKRNVVLTGTDDFVDFSENETVFELAGDVNGAVQGDDYVNGVDLSALTKNIYTNVERYDMNRDYYVNGLEYSIAITHIYGCGELFDPACKIRVAPLAATEGVMPPDGDPRP